MNLKTYQPIPDLLDYKWQDLADSMHRSYQFGLLKRDGSASVLYEDVNNGRDKL